MADDGASTRLVLIERAPEGYAVLTLNRPSKLNALSAALRAEIVAVFSQLANDPDVRVVILTGAGRAFCAGVDLNELARDINDLRVGGSDDPVAAMAAFPGPIIGAINGPAVTGGLELALACDVLIAGDDAVFGDTHARVGVMPGWGMSPTMSRLIGLHRAKELAFTGNFLDADRAERWGLVNRVVASAELMEAARALARDMLSAAPGMLVAYKRLINEGFALPYGEARANEQAQANSSNERVEVDALGARTADVRHRGQALTSAANR